MREFKFTIRLGPKDEERGVVEAKSRVCTAKEDEWHEVPLAAMPVLEKGWPKMPEYMNGRQYFLWWKNDFKLNEDPDKGEVGSPIIHNPFPPLDNVRYEMGGEGSRRWGA